MPSKLKRDNKQKMINAQCLEEINYLPTWQTITQRFVDQFKSSKYWGDNELNIIKHF